jgi:hypothetical protein
MLAESLRASGNTLLGLARGESTGSPIVTSPSTGRSAGAVPRGGGFVSGPAARAGAGTGLSSSVTAVAPLPQGQASPLPSSPLAGTGSMHRTSSGAAVGLATSRSGSAEEAADAGARPALRAGAVAGAARSNDGVSSLGGAGAAPEDSDADADTPLYDAIEAAPLEDLISDMRRLTGFKHGVAPTHEGDAGANRASTRPQLPRGSSRSAATPLTPFGLGTGSASTASTLSGPATHAQGSSLRASGELGAGELPRGHSQKGSHFWDLGGSLRDGQTQLQQQQPQRAELPEYELVVASVEAGGIGVRSPAPAGLAEHRAAGGAQGSGERTLLPALPMPVFHEVPDGDKRRGSARGMMSPLDQLAAKLRDTFPAAEGYLMSSTDASRPPYTGQPQVSAAGSSFEEGQIAAVAAFAASVASAGADAAAAFSRPPSEGWARSKHAGSDATAGSGRRSSAPDPAVDPRTATDEHGTDAADSPPSGPLQGRFSAGLTTDGVAPARTDVCASAAESAGAAFGAPRAVGAFSRHQRGGSNENPYPLLPVAGDGGVYARAALGAPGYSAYHGSSGGFDAGFVGSEDASLAGAAFGRFSMASDGEVEADGPSDFHYSGRPSAFDPGRARRELAAQAAGSSHARKRSSSGGPPGRSGIGRSDAALRSPSAGRVRGSTAGYAATAAPAAAPRAGEGWAQVPSLATHAGLSDPPVPLAAAASGTSTRAGAASRSGLLPPSATVHAAAARTGLRAAGSYEALASPGASLPAGRPGATPSRIPRLFAVNDSAGPSRSASPDAQARGPQLSAAVLSAGRRPVKPAHAATDAAVARAAARAAAAAEARARARAGALSAGSGAAAHPIPPVSAPSPSSAAHARAAAAAAAAGAASAMRRPGAR